VKSTYNSHVKRIILGIVVLAICGYGAKRVLTPATFGKYGHYRADAIEEEAGLDIRHYTNTSCFSCHAWEAQIHLEGKHKSISCEFCHGAYADHVREDKKFAALPVKRDQEIVTLCMRCHNSAITARPHDVIKTVVLPGHLEEQKVKPTHTCNQCHHQHAPLKYINRAKAMVGIKEAS